ncbi:MAG: RsmB/NOP family class I SAM-dependent RNA methyltransferase [Candidatus Altiarchaeota archaeon]
MKLPPGFEAYHKRLYGADYGKFINYFMTHKERFSLRVNTLKTDMRELKRILAEHRITYGPVSWCPDGLWVDSGSLDYMEHQMGLYYIQSASSMIAPQVLGPGKRVLDLCAAPGGKTTHLAQLMGNKGLIVANDDSHARIKGLVYNIQRCGLTNAVVTLLDGCRYDQYGERFDRILLDAPCSSVGTMRQNREVLADWSLEWARQLSQVQKKMILSAYDSLLDKGRIVYSTCTTTLEENEHVIEHLLKERPEARLNKVRLDGIRLRRGMTEAAADCARVFPTDDDTEPHFIAEVVKGG